MLEKINLFISKRTLLNITKSFLVYFINMADSKINPNTLIWSNKNKTRGTFKSNVTI